MILKEIRIRTADRHTSLESSKLLLPLTSSELTLSGYIAVLIKFYGFFYPIENIATRFPELLEWLPDYGIRRKASAILQDLKQLQSDTEVHDLELCTDLPEINNINQLIGSLYVLEGSTLGGKIISKSIKQHLNIDETSGALFFNVYGEELGFRWKLFQEALNNISNAHDSHEEIVSSANQTFLKLEQWINYRQQ